MSVLMLACSSNKKRPILSGLLWGGEGSRIIIKHADSSINWSDTIIINHLGEFEWFKDSIQTGFYRLEKTSGEGLMFFLKKGSAVYIDALYVTYPQETKIKGSDISLDILAVENNSRKWIEEIAHLSDRTKASSWSVSDLNMHELKSDFDSIREIYKNHALEISTNPLVRYIALLQQAGNNPLFDPWIDRHYYFELDSLLKTDKQHNQFDKFNQFNQKVDSLHRIDLQHRKIKPGSAFPEISLPNMWGDTISISQFRKSPLYIEIWNPSMKENARIHSSTFSLINRYRRQELEVYLIAIDTITATWKDKIREQNLYYQNVIDLDGSASVLYNKLGIMQLPSNFLVDTNGVVMAKNIWGDQLEQGIDLLLKK